MKPPIKIPAAEINEFMESMGIPVMKTVEHVPGARVIPIPIKIPPAIALIITFLFFGYLKMNSFERYDEIKDPTINPIFTIKAKRKAVFAPSFPMIPIIGRKLLPPIQNLLIKKYMKTLRKAKQLTQNK